MLKLLYINGTYEGGSIISTRELLAQIRPAEVDARLIRAHEDRALHGYLGRRMTNLAVKLGGPEPDNLVERMNRWWGRQAKQVSAAEWSTTAVENAGAAFLESWAPDVVVVSSVDRVAWRRIRRDTKRAGVPCALYLREEALLPHLDLTHPPDFLLANSRGIVESCTARGYDATFIPSVIDLPSCETTSDRSKALLINPSEHYGLELAIELAAQCPAIGFVFQESTKSSQADLDRARSASDRLANIEYRTFSSDPSAVYRDARVLLAPYTPYLESNRPRSVLEAHWNGIPVVGTARAGLRDAVGPGGILLAADAPIADWRKNLEALFESGPFYDDLATQAHDYARRSEVDPVSIALMFEAVLREEIASGH